MKKVAVAETVADFREQLVDAITNNCVLGKFTEPIFSDGDTMSFSEIGMDEIDGQEIILSLSEKFDIDLSGDGAELIKMTVPQLHAFCIKKATDEAKQAAEMRRRSMESFR